MHDLECARYAFNGRHLRIFGLRQRGEARAPTLHAVKPFGPSIDHWMRIPFAGLILWRQAVAALFKIEHLPIQTQNATKLETSAWRRRAGIGNCNPPVSMGLTKVEKGSKGGQAYRLDGSDNDFAFFTCSTIIGAEIKSWLLRFDPGKDQRLAALGARRSDRIDKLEGQGFCHGKTIQRRYSSDSESIPHGETNLPRDVPGRVLIEIDPAPLSLMSNFFLMDRRAGFADHADARVLTGRVLNAQSLGQLASVSYHG
jgi:hypothetical protein